MRRMEVTFTSAEHAAQYVVAEPEIRHVSDTALWVASLRGQEKWRRAQPATMSRKMLSLSGAVLLQRVQRASDQVGSECS